MLSLKTIWFGDCTHHIRASGFLSIQTSAKHMVLLLCICSKRDQYSKRQCLSMGVKLQLPKVTTSPGADVGDVEVRACKGTWIQVRRANVPNTSPSTWLSERHSLTACSESYPSCTRKHHHRLHLRSTGGPPSPKQLADQDQPERAPGCLECCR